MFHFLQQFVKMSIKSLLTNKGRSLLTMLGIIIGVGAVIVIMALGSGAQNLIIDQIKTLGTDIVGILPGKSEDEGPPASAMGIVITTLTYDDAIALNKKKNVPNIISVAAYSTGVANMSWGSHEYVGNLNGTTIGHLEISKTKLEAGRFFTEEEEKSLARVAVLGSTVKQELFGDSDAIGQRIKIKKHTFKVIGVMKEKGTVAFQDYDNEVYLPIKATQKLILGVNHVAYIRVKVDSEENLDRVINDIKITLREKHDIDDATGKNDDFTVRSAAQALDIITTVTDSLRYFLAAMAAMSLVVGGIGIMNIMLVSVSERTHEIGLRKAIGATKNDILIQFLIETISITFVGGLIGIIFGMLIAYLISLIINILGYNWDYIVSTFSIILAVGVSIVIGLVFGLYPANKASKLEPIEALQYE